MELNNQKNLMKNLKKLSALLMIFTSFSAYAGNPGILTVTGKLKKVANSSFDMCEGTPYPYRVQGDYRIGRVIYNASLGCFDSVALPLDGSQDHGGSPSGNLLTDALDTLDRHAGKLVKMTFTVYDMDNLNNGLQTLLSIEPIK